MSSRGQQADIDVTSPNLPLNCINRMCLCCVCFLATSYRLGFGRVLPPVPGVQRQSGLTILQRPWTPRGLPGNTHTVFSHADNWDVCFVLICSAVWWLCVPDVWLQSRHVEPGLHAGQYDLSERALLPRTRQLRSGACHTNFYTRWDKRVNIKNWFHAHLR